MHIQSPTKPIIFEPNGQGNFPKILIRRMEKCQPGKSGKADFYLIEITNHSSSEEIQFDSYKQVQEYLDREYDGKFTKAT